MDDDRLDLLTEELIDIQQCARDQDGRMLVWTGETGSPGPDARHSAEAEMRFHAMLSAVIALLQRDRRITYRTLKYILGLDGALLDEIREELTLRQIAVDEQGKVLVWTGETQPVAPSVVEVPRQPTTEEATVIPQVMRWFSVGFSSA